MKCILTMKMSVMFLLFLFLVALSTTHARPLSNETSVSEKKLADLPAADVSDSGDSSEEENGGSAFDGNHGKRPGFDASFGGGAGGGFDGGIDVHIGRGFGIDARFGGGAGGGLDGSLGFGGGRGGGGGGLGGGDGDAGVGLGGVNGGVNGGFGSPSP